ncbi:hypothetical protein T05_4978 [Trichinella murrelli]|uniref:Uncharacterized protein n=1 Tax=Trichinella murrelli TaxID=144512 RepID=A0A0V0U4L0_9BILA|nr:hypothetical protein T05_4978 [Trichinella murrelli]
MLNGVCYGCNGVFFSLTANSSPFVENPANMMMLKKRISGKDREYNVASLFVTRASLVKH